LLIAIIITRRRKKTRIVHVYPVEQPQIEQPEENSDLNSEIISIEEMMVSDPTPTPTPTPTPDEEKSIIEEVFIPIVRTHTPEAIIDVSSKQITSPANVTAF